LYNQLNKIVSAEPALEKVYTEIEMPLLNVLSNIERTGVLVDADLLLAQSDEIAAKVKSIEALAHEDAGQEFNLGSSKQIGELLYEVKGMYHQAVASTGRLSSSDPNLQNIPIRTHEGRRIREAFIAPKGYKLLAADYSQIELRIMAHLSADESLLSAFESGDDIHSATAAEVFGADIESVDADQRRAAKAINFGLIYGMSAFGLARQLDISRTDAQQYINLYFERYPGVKRYMDSTRLNAKHQGYVETVFGRRLIRCDNTQSAQRLTHQCKVPQQISLSVQ